MASERDLLQQNSSQDQLDPLNDQDSLDPTQREQEKRTIFTPSISNYAWAKHVAIRPSGAKHIIGYSPVDLKLRPVLRPISIKHQGYHYDKPRIQLHLKKPVIQVPIRPVFRTSLPHIIKPLRPAHLDHVHAVNHIHVKPESHLDHIHAKPSHIHFKPHVDHIHAVPVNQVHAHLDHVHAYPVQHLDHVHAHVDHVHQVPVAHHDHTHAVGHVDHIHNLQVPVHLQQVRPVIQPISPAVQQVVPAVQPIVPAPHPVIHQVAQPFVPSLFEVTKPNLGVLPFGAVFPSQVLKDIPAPNLAPALPVLLHHIASVPAHHAHPVFPSHTVAQIHPQPIAPPHLVASVHPQHVGHAHPQHVGAVLPPHIHVQAGTHAHENPVQHVHPAHPVSPTVEYHGATNFINLVNSQSPALAQAPVNAGYPLLPNHFHLNYPQIPQHTQVTTINQNEALVPSTHPNLFSPQQHLPLEGQSHFQDAGQNVFQQQLPQAQSNFQPETQINSQDNQPNFQPADEVSNQHFFQSLPNRLSGYQQPSGQSDDQGYIYQQPDLPNIQQQQQQSIQPGQTDVQLPLYLPQHPNYDNSRQQGQASEISQSVFRPSIQLEPPYKK